MHLPKKMQKFPHGLVPRWWNYALLQKICNHFQEATKVPLPPLLVIGAHPEPTIFHVPHDPSCHENPPNNLPYENLKHQDSKGVLRVVRGHHTYPNQVMTCNSMRFILRHGDIKWDVECHITYRNPNINFLEHSKEIEKLLQKYEK